MNGLYSHPEVLKIDDLRRKENGHRLRFYRVNQAKEANNFLYIMLRVGCIAKWVDWYILITAGVFVLCLS